MRRGGKRPSDRVKTTERFLIVFLCLVQFGLVTAASPEFQNRVSESIDSELQGMDDKDRGDQSGLLNTAYVDIWEFVDEPSEEIAELYSTYVSHEAARARSAFENGSSIEGMREQVELFAPDHRRGIENMPVDQSIEKTMETYNVNVTEFLRLLSENIEARFASQRQINVSVLACKRLSNTNLPADIIAYTDTLEDSDKARSLFFSVVLKTTIEERRCLKEQELKLRKDYIEFNKLILYYNTASKQHLDSEFVSVLLDRLEMERPETFTEIAHWSTDMDRIFGYAATNWISSTKKDRSYEARKYSGDLICSSFVYTDFRLIPPRR